MHQIKTATIEILIQLGGLAKNLSDESLKVPTNEERELVYNIEHAIHHMAIIRIGIENDFPHAHLPDKFGFAYSTIKHLKS